MWADGQDKLEFLSFLLLNCPRLTHLVESFHPLARLNPCTLNTNKSAHFFVQVWCCLPYQILKERLFEKSKRSDTLSSLLSWSHYDVRFLKRFPFWKCHFLTYFLRENFHLFQQCRDCVAALFTVGSVPHFSDTVGTHNVGAIHCESIELTQMEKGSI